MLTLAVIALILPAGVRRDRAQRPTPQLESISAWIAIALLLVYVANVAFTLAASRAANARRKRATRSTDDGHAHHAPQWSMKKAVIVLAAVSAGIIWMSEILVARSNRPAGAGLVGRVHRRVRAGGDRRRGRTGDRDRRRAPNRMDLAMSIALGASVQLALLVAPLLVLLSYVVGPHPMGLVFGPGLVLTILFRCIITGQVASDGRTDWLRGVQLLAVYLILGAVFFYVPDVR